MLILFTINLSKISYFDLHKSHSYILFVDGGTAHSFSWKMVKRRQSVEARSSQKNSDLCRTLNETLTTFLVNI